MKNKIIILSFILVLMFFSIYSFILKDEKISYSERRKLEQVPKISIESVFSGTYTKKLNDYFTDQFPLRDYFRKLKGTISNKIFNKNENNGVFIKEDTIYQLDENINEKSIHHFTELLKKIRRDYIKTDNIYYSIIPDKNYYLNDKSIPKLDYQSLFNKIRDDLEKEYKYIDITNSLNSNSYYKTDIHWKQETLKPVVQKLATTMNFKISNEYFKENLYTPFYGALYGRIASNINPDTITYLTNNTIENSKVYNYEKQKIEKVYQENYLKHVDSYDIYLSGATPLLIITNPNQTNKKELILFRDSFGSSIAPLMIESYSKITMIDLRYLSSSLLGQIEEIDFTYPNLDILFLYSIPIINNSFTLK